MDNILQIEVLLLGGPSGHGRLVNTRTLNSIQVQDDIQPLREHSQTLLQQL
jgi:hypothetical protein